MAALPSVFNVQGLRNSPGIADVTFRFNLPGLNGDVETKAHKAVLAYASEIFKTQFFGSFPSEETVLVEDASIDTFSIFLDIIYNVSVDFKELNPGILGELFYLAEKYRIGCVKIALVEYVKAKEIKTDEVLEVFRIAESNSHLEEFASSLFMSCAKFTHKCTVSELLQLFDEDVEEQNSAFLHRFMKFMSKAFHSKCKNCQHLPCLDNEYLSKENFVKDAVIIKVDIDINNTDATRKTISFEGLVMVKYQISNNIHDWSQGCL